MKICDSIRGNGMQSRVSIDAVTIVRHGVNLRGRGKL